MSATLPRVTATDTEATRGRWFDGLAAPLCCVILLVGAVAARRTRPLRDPDTWWHLRTGEELWGAWRIDAPGSLSPFATQEWVARDWLPQMLASKVSEHFGLPGVAWLAGASVLTLAVITWFTARHFAGPLISAFAVMVSTYGSAASHSPRPQLVSFVLMAVLVGAWMRTGDDGRPRWYVVPLIGVWACCHGMWIVGVATSLLCVAALVVDRRPRAVWAPLLALTVMGVGLALLTPAGAGVVTSAVGRNPVREFVTEWQPVEILESPTALATLLAVGITAACHARSGAVSWLRIVLLASAAFWTIFSGRTVALGAVIVAPLLAEALQQAIGGRFSWVRRREVATLALAFFVGLVALVPGVARVTASPEAFPVGMNDTLEALPSGTTVFNAHRVGGWLEWRHRHLVVVVDGNTPAYGARYQTAFVGALFLRPGWQQFIAETGPDFALLGDSTPLASGLGLLGWQPVARDGQFLLLQAPAAGPA